MGEAERFDGKFHGPSREELDRDHDEAMRDDAHKRAVQCTVIAGHLAKEYGILVTPTVVEYVLQVAEHLGYIEEWESWYET